MYDQDLRAAKRFKISGVPVYLKSESIVTEGYLLDISLTGAFLKECYVPENSVKVTFQPTENIEITRNAQITRKDEWDHSWLAIEFDEPLSPFEFGRITNEGIKKEYEEHAEKTIEEARQLAKGIEERARKTAAHISVEGAQEQFKLAQKDIRKHVIIWSVLSVLSVLAFIGTAIYLSSIQFPEEWTWSIIYHTAVRIIILTAIGAVAAFCLKILRAHLHMSQHNLHRQRIANSMAAFVESAVTPEQRDIILTHLVDAVANFGDSGLLSREKDSIHSSKLTVDTAQKGSLKSSPSETERSSE
ncbi:MAG: PilZ domain-containing protein [Nitrospirota bacterium]